ncbi:High mobility group B protein 14 [Linum grandiflorum]
MVAKEASKSTKSSSSPPSTPGERRMVLRIKSGQGAMNSVTQVSFSSEDDRRLAVKKKSSKKKKKKLVKFDSKAPKKAPTAFLLFFYPDYSEMVLTTTIARLLKSEMDDFRKDYQEQNPEVKNICDVGKAGAEKWKTMGYEESDEQEDSDYELEDN